MNNQSADIIKIAATIIIDNKFLIVNPTGKDYWNNVGGRLESNETFMECLSRELKEELNLEVDGIPELLTTTPATPALGDPGKTVQIYFYLTQVKNITDLQLGEEINQIHWLNKEDYLQNKFNISPQIRDYLLPKLIDLALLK